jgi:hypothetical protein
VAGARNQLRATLCALAIVLAPEVASAQTNAQLWGSVTLNWLKGSDTTLEIDVEPKVLVSAPPGEPGWWSVDVTPSIEHALSHRVDLVGELATGYTKQTDEKARVVTLPILHSLSPGPPLSVWPHPGREVERR